MVSRARTAMVLCSAGVALVAVLGAAAVAVGDARSSAATSISAIEPAEIDATSVETLRVAVEQQKSARAALVADLRSARAALAAASRASAPVATGGAPVATTGESNRVDDDARDAAEDARDDAEDAAEDARKDAEDAADDARDAEGDHDDD